MKSSIDRDYTSEADIFLSETREKTPESHDQRVEREKYEQISKKRDEAQPKEEEKPSIWDVFDQ